MSGHRSMFCPMCGKTMVKRGRDPKTYREKGLLNEVVEVVHVYYGCPNEECQTQVRLRYRKDGKEGDLNKLVNLRKELAKSGHVAPMVTDVEGNIKGLI